MESDPLVNHDVPSEENNTPPPSSETAKITAEQRLESEVDAVNKRNESENLNKLLLVNSFYYIFVMVVFGVPIWLLTTTTYRANLPFDEIYQISSMKSLSVRVNFDLVFSAKSLPSNQQGFEEQLLKELYTDLDQEYGLVLNFKVNTRTLSQSEADLMTRLKSFEELDERLASGSVNQLSIYFLEDDVAQAIGLTTPNEFVILNNCFTPRREMSVVKLAAHIKSQYLRASKLAENFNPKFKSLRKLPSKDDLKVINFDSDYEITFTLLNENPERFKDWNIDFCIKQYFQKIVDQLAVFTRFRLKAQTLLYSDFGSYQLARYSGADGNSFSYLKHSDLSIMTNFIEGRLGSRVSDSSALEFVTYLPSKRPLHIVSDLQKPQESKSNSFLVPRWGGVYIYNDGSEAEETVRADEPVKTFLFQFIDLIGIRLNTEIFGYLLEKTLENQLNSINTLKSLSSLLTRISNMVIEDDIAEKVKQSVDAIQKSLISLKEGNMTEAFHASKTAFVMSEKAFFDKSLLEKLYFPEDQRFAIYIPLFVPVGIPVLLSAKSIVKWFKLRKAKTD